MNQKRKLEIQGTVYKVKYVECRSRDGEKIMKVKFLDYEVISKILVLRCQNTKNTEIMYRVQTYLKQKFREDVEIRRCKYSVINKEKEIERI